MKDAVATMGSILPDDASGRDAVHIAVISVVAGELLAPGQHIGLTDETVDGERVATAGSDKMLGIVDPFISDTDNIRKGQRFWLYIYPRQITGLNHQWSHPDLPLEGRPTGEQYAPPAQKLASEQWLKDFCSKSDCPGFHAVMGVAELIADGGSGSDYDDEYIHFDGQDAHGEIPAEFWEHVSIYLGRPIRGKKATYFSCSC